MYELQSDAVQEHLSSVSLSDLPGVGWRLGGKLKEKGFTRCSELWGIPLEILQVGRRGDIVRSIITTPRRSGLD